jgi:hypothetical protein
VITTFDAVLSFVVKGCSEIFGYLLKFVIILSFSKKVYLAPQRKAAIFEVL